MTLATLTGAAGKTGRAIVAELARRGARVRALVHLEERGEGMLEAGATEVSVGDLTDRRSLERALADSTAVYHICPNMRPDEIEIGARVIEVCQAVGVERLVYHSVLHPQVEAMPHHWRKLRVEERLIESGLSFTILQPAAYMQNLKAQWPKLVDDGVYEVPYAASTKLGMVDLRDVAEAAARVLTEPGHEGVICELCGPEILDQNEIAGVLARRLGRSVEVSVEDHETWAGEARASGLSEDAVETLLAMFRHYERHGFWGSPRALENMLGRPATSLERVVSRWEI